MLACPHGALFTLSRSSVVLTEYSILVLFMRNVRSGADLLESPAELSGDDLCEWAEVRARETRLWRGSSGWSSSPHLGIMAIRAHSELLWSTRWQDCSVRWSTDDREAPRSSQEGSWAVAPGPLCQWTEEPSRLVTAPASYLLWLVSSVHYARLPPDSVLNLNIWKGDNHLGCRRLRRVEGSISFFQRLGVADKFFDGVWMTVVHGLLHINETLTERVLFTGQSRQLLVKWSEALDV